MRVFCDHHHQALFNSLQILFEDRLGWELYRPIGTEWFDQGYWMVYNHPATVNQFLGIHQGEKLLDTHGDPYPEEAQVNKHAELRDDIYFIKDISHEKHHKAVTLDIFKDMEFDIVISSIPAHISRFNRLIAEHQPKAKHIFQVGNAWGHQADVKNILASTAPFPVPAGINTCFYHQEFDLNVFKYQPPTITGVVNSYVHYMRKPEIMTAVAGFLPPWKFTTYGAGMMDSLPGIHPMAAAMTNSSFTWHYKPEGDGYGHTLHNSYACGRPAIIWGDQYKGKLADALFQDGVTCIDARGKTPHQIATSLVTYGPPAKHARMCEAAYNRFKEVVDFDEEAATIKKFLENLQ